MFSENKVTLPQLIDRMLQRSTLTLFLLAVTYSAAAGARFASDGLAEYFEIARLVLPVASVAVSLPTAIALALRYMKKGDNKSLDPDGFLQAVYSKASMYAFTITFMFMIIYDTFLSKVLFRSLPAHTVVHIILAVAFFALSFCFYFMSRDSSDDIDVGGN